VSGSVSFYVPEQWGREKREQIGDALREVNAKREDTAPTFAGASGLQPELSLLVQAATALVAAGFLTAMGEDIWKGLKAAIRKVSKIRPDTWGQDLPPEISVGFPLQGVLLWGLEFQGLRALLILPLEADQVDRALDALPEAMDRAYAKAPIGKSRQRFVRLHWDEGRWTG
jgi:hypothetical protein